MSEFTAPCIGGPLSGGKLSYDYEHGQAQPKEYIIQQSTNGEYVSLGRYDFACAIYERQTQARSAGGDSWVWHPYLAGM